MPSLRNLLTDWSWRVAVLALPWQTRWFQEGVFLNGFPWENGRLSFYVSWVPLLVFTVLAFLGKRESETVEKGYRTRGLFFAGFFLLVCASFFTTAPIATIVWWIEMLLLASFATAVIKLRVPRLQLATWFVIALAPHALLGLQQYITQSVIAMKWLGIAPQLPSTAGVSVVEYAGGRFLRAYGGFPHPNIFGAWLAVALPIILWLAVQAKNRRASLVWVSVAGVFALCLALTFSRGSWIAFLVGMGAMAFAFFRREDVLLKTLAGTYAALFVLLFAGFLFLHRDLVIPRLQSATRLERLSTDERWQSFQDGFAIFRDHPFIGVGPGAADFAVAQLRPTDRPPVPPHFVPLLVLVETGAMGFVGLLLLLFSGIKRLDTRNAVAAVPLLTLFLIGLFDHHPWSSWSGMVLTAFCLVFLFLEPKTEA